MDGIFFLLSESMVEMVLLARDKYLKKDGLIFPENASLFLAVIEAQDYKDEKINGRRSCTNIAI